MIRCQIEVVERHMDKKDVESREPQGIMTRRLAFDALLRRDEQRWLTIDNAQALCCTAERAQRELVAGDFQRFVNWMAMTHGHALVRAAGLPIARPYLSVASA